MNAYSKYAGGFTDQGSYTADNLIAGEFPIVQRVETITGGKAYPRGAVLGRMTASGAYTLSDASATDGTEKPVCILAQSIDTTQGDIKAVVYHSGEFNSNVLTYGTGHDAASVCSSWRVNGPSTLFLRHNQEV
ncbi:head decoration protein [Bartonella sp. DGB2]|uniref:head decoration protein n=1 Tax=Bartonella sp. DGB2 TaxID=3388426 RepID=UPI00398FF73F